MSRFGIRKSTYPVSDRLSLRRGGESVLGRGGVTRLSGDCRAEAPVDRGVDNDEEKLPAVEATRLTMHDVSGENNAA